DSPKDVAVAPASTPVERIEQAVMLMEKPEKRPFLVQALENQFRTIIFTRTKHGADQLVKYLSKQKIVASAIHGNKSQNQRQRTLEAFRKGEEHILIATDIAARGIDIPDVSLVVNYDVPTTPEAYVHRIGRTARAGREGRAITLCAPEEQKHLRDIEKLIKVKLPIENVQAGGIDDDGYDPMKAAAKPSGKSSGKSSGKFETRGARQDDGERRSPKSRRRNDAKKPGAGSYEGKKSGPKKPKPRHRGEAASADGPGAPRRKKGGSKNPPRGPARRRNNNRQTGRNSEKSAR
ncbi:helicase C-terminal domain-containing protein, partial [Alphaproteobacteria bacterium]|nr:helicase C-terminal domain-containing protein [Alphaproteobacteria bacterium]